MNVKAFTSLRGVACVIVVIIHAMTVFDLDHLIAPGTTQYWLRMAIEGALNGSAAVQVFFVLSGCVLCLSLNNGAARSGTPWIERFYVRRIFRIYPALWLSVVLTLVLWWAIKSPAAGASGVLSDWATSAYPDAPTAKLVALTLGGLYVHLNWPMWTLRVELFYSLAFPVLFLLIRNPRTRLPSLGLLLAIAVAPMIPRNLSLHYALAFALGAAIPFTTSKRNLPYRAIAAVAFVVLMYSRIVLEHLHVDWKSIEDIEIVVSAIVIYCLYHNKAPVPVLENRTVSFIGDISYSVYIIHFPILFALASAMLAVVGPAFVHAQPLASVLLLGLVTLAATLVAAALSRRYVERPGEQAGRALCNALFGPRPAAPRLHESTKQN